MTTSRPPRTKAQRASGKPKPPRMLARARVAAAVETMAAPTGAARFAAGKALYVTAEKDPARVYPHFDTLVALVESDSKIVRWNAMQIVASVAPVDVEHKLDMHLDTYLGFIRGDNLITAANAIQGAAKIARCRPDLLDRIIMSIVEVEHAAYETPECRNVAIGQAIDALRKLGSDVCRRREVSGFIDRQRANPRAKVARSAERLAASLATGA